MKFGAKEAEVNFFSGLTKLHKSLRAMCINLQAKIDPGKHDKEIILIDSKCF